VTVDRFSVKDACSPSTLLRDCPELIEATNEKNARKSSVHAELVEAFLDSRATGTHHSPAEEFFETIEMHSHKEQDHKNGRGNSYSNIQSG
jgi:hypothetical protein